jgi:1-acyl-sn-glycerol-3-phosphate acyltransferase
MRTILSIWGWLMITLSASLGFVIQVCLIILTLGLDRNRILTGRVFRLSAVCATKLHPFWRFRTLGDAPKHVGAAVVILNHCSHSDSFLISRVPWEMKWLGKKSLFKIPIVGWSMTLSGDIGIRRGDKNSINDAMNQCRTYLERGVPIMMFPEGTRSRTDDMLPFKDGAFQLAIEAGVPVLPIAIDGTKTALPKADWRFGFSRAMVTVGEPISTAGLSLDDISDLKDKGRVAVDVLRQKIRVHLAD